MKIQTIAESFHEYVTTCAPNATDAETLLLRTIFYTGYASGLQEITSISSTLSERAAGAILTRLKQELREPLQNGPLISPIFARYYTHLRSTQVEVGIKDAKISFYAGFLMILTAVHQLGLNVDTDQSVQILNSLADEHKAFNPNLLDWYNTLTPQLRPGKQPFFRN